MRSTDTVRIGSGAGTSDDRMVPALELSERGDIDYLVFECLAERTVSRENLSRSKDPDQAYAPSLHARLRMVLPTCIKKKIRIVSNMGAANPVGGARAARAPPNGLAAPMLLTMRMPLRMQVGSTMRSRACSDGE